MKQRIRLALRVVCICYTVDDLLSLVAGYLLVVGLNVAEVVAAIVMRFAHAHRVVGEVDIAVVAEELGHDDGVNGTRRGEARYEQRPFDTKGVAGG